jgi:CAAX prenyl protease-like protein
MNPLRELLQRSSAHARVAPLFIFLLIPLAGGLLGADGKFWVYLAKTLVGVWLIVEMRKVVPEMRWALSWEAVVVGVLVCVLWVGLDPYYPMNNVIMKPTPGDEWNPAERFGAGTAMAWFFIAVRILGSSLVVPPLEEVFYRSFLYRKFIKDDFMQVPFGYFAGASFMAVSVLFGLMHYQWLPGILCGMLYLGLVIRKKRLGDAMTAHAVTNFLLGIWVVWKGAWQFW